MLAAPLRGSRKENKIWEPVRARSSYGVSTLDWRNRWQHAIQIDSNPDDLGKLYIIFTVSGFHVSRHTQLLF
jgi:hypothetical protein